MTFGYPQQVGSRILRYGAGPVLCILSFRLTSIFGFRSVLHIFIFRVSLSYAFATLPILPTLNRYPPPSPFSTFCFVSAPAGAVYLGRTQTGSLGACRGCLSATTSPRELAMRTSVGMTASRSPVTCHGGLKALLNLSVIHHNGYNIPPLVLDSSIGKPAVDIGVFLEQFNFETSTFDMLGKGYIEIHFFILC